MIEGTRYIQSYQCKGIDHPNSKFNNKIVKDIREKHTNEHIGIKKLAHFYKCCPSTIQAMIYGITWKGAGGPIHIPSRRHY